jgi:hypothetical protein
MKTMLMAAKLEIRNSKLEKIEAGRVRIQSFGFRISNFEFRGPGRAA